MFFLFLFRDLKSGEGIDTLVSADCFFWGGAKSDILWRRPLDQQDDGRKA